MATSLERVLLFAVGWNAASEEGVLRWMWRKAASQRVDDLSILKPHLLRLIESPVFQCAVEFEWIVSLVFARAHHHVRV